MTQENELLDYTNPAQMREYIRQRAVDAISKIRPISNKQGQLTIENARIKDPRPYTLEEQKKAILGGRSLGDKLVGEYVLRGPDGKEISRTRPMTLMNVPYYTDRGTFIRGGSETVILKQLRLRPGVYARKTNDGAFDAQFNAKPGTGTSMNMRFDPEKALFYLKYRGRNIPAYPVMSSIGISDADMQKTWGKDIFEINRKQRNSPHAISFLRGFLPEEEAKAEQQMELDDLHGADVDAPDEIQNLDKEASSEGLTLEQIGPKVRMKLLDTFSKVELDPETTKDTLGAAHDRIRPATFLAASGKLLGMSRGELGEDDRDSMRFQSAVDAGDFIGERIELDQGKLLRNALYKGTWRGNLNHIPPAMLDKHIDHLYSESAGLAQHIEEHNPTELFDQNQRITRLGLGGISSLDSVPDSARNVQASYLGYIDAVRSPESLKVGVDMRLARNVRKGKDNQLYTQFINSKTGRKEWVAARDAARKNISFERIKPGRTDPLPGIDRQERTTVIDPQDVDYEVASPDDIWSYASNLTPIKSDVKGMRLLMGAKFAVSSTSLAAREAPLVRNLGETEGRSAEDEMGDKAGNLRSTVAGAVTKVDKNGIYVKDSEGKETFHEMYVNFPFNRKALLTNYPTVKPGDVVKPGQLLANSNFTDGNGTLASGLNARIAYTNHMGNVYEDMLLISESMSKRLASDHIFNDEYEDDDETKTDKERFTTIYPGRFTKEQLGKIDKTGVPAVGTILQNGDPMRLATRVTAASPATMGRSLRADASVTWEHEFPAEVVAVTPTASGYRIYTKARVPMQEGDKIAIRQGGKGVVRILPDDQMPADKSGLPFEVVSSPLAVSTRTNASQLVEAALGKVAAKTGKPYVLPGFQEGDIAQFARDELSKNGLSATEDIIDQRTGRVIPKVGTGLLYVYKQPHMAEFKGKSRSTGAYSLDDIPAKGGDNPAKHLGTMEWQALVAHGALSVLKDAKLVRGQKNDDFWTALKTGGSPTMPQTPYAYHKFKANLLAAGINMKETPEADSIFAMTGVEAAKLTEGREITSAHTFDAKMNPVPGGLFDPDKTGSRGLGDRWSYIRLPEPMPNPIMIAPLRNLLGMTQKGFEQELTDKGGAAMKERLASMDLKKIRQEAIDQVRTGPASKRDDAVKRIQFSEAMLRANKTPVDFMLDVVPVLPPRYRPIKPAGSMTIVADPNYMYKALLDSTADFKDTKDKAPELLNDARKPLWENYKALVGVTGSPQEELADKEVGGLLQQIVGKGSPKHSPVQRKVIATNMEMNALNVITFDGSLDIDQVGLPKEHAWTLYEPFIVRDLVRSGVEATQAAKEVALRTGRAEKSLQSVVKERPVIYNRAPTLHKYSMMAAYPVLHDGKTLRISPHVAKPYGADADGDTMSWTVPVSDAAVREAKQKMLPSRHLLGSRDDNPLYKPEAELVQGMHYASKAPSTKPVQYFKTEADAMKAFRQGLIDIDDPVEIGS